MEENVNVQAVEAKKSNGLGVAGFVLGLLGFICCWWVLVGWITTWIFAVPGAVLAIIGIFKKNAKKGLAICGAILAVAAIIIYYVKVAAVSNAVSSALDGLQQLN